MALLSNLGRLGSIFGCCPISPRKGNPALLQPKEATVLEFPDYPQVPLETRSLSKESGHSCDRTVCYFDECCRDCGEHLNECACPF